MVRGKPAGGLLGASLFGAEAEGKSIRESGADCQDDQLDRREMGDELT
jgi:hypothetical protein